MSNEFQKQVVKAIDHQVQHLLFDLSLSNDTDEEKLNVEKRAYEKALHDFAENWNQIKLFYSLHDLLLHFYTINKPVTATEVISDIMKSQIIVTDDSGENQ